MSRLLLVPLDDVVVFPGMSLDAGDRRRRRRARAARAPSRAGFRGRRARSPRSRDRVRLPGGGRAFEPAGPAPRRRRCRPDAARRPAVRRGRRAARRRARSTARPATWSASTAPWSRRSSSCAATTAASPASCARISEPGTLADTSGYSPDLNYEQKVKLLQTLDVTERLELALGYQRERLAELQVRKRIREDVESGAEKQQREYFLRKQMESIRKELDEDDASIVEEYRTKIEEAGMPEHAASRPRRSSAGWRRWASSRAESSVIRTYLDWLIAVPWSEHSEEKLDPVHARDDPRRGPRRPGGRQGPDRRVHRGQEAARRARHHTRTSAPARSSP